MATRSAPSRPSRPLVIDGAVPVGLALIVLGVLLALDNLEVVDASELLAGWWPLAVILAGVWWMVTGSPAPGLATVAVGAMLLLATLGVVELPLGRLILPGLLVVVGGSLLQAGVRLRAAQVEVGDGPSPGRGPAAADTQGRSSAGDGWLAGPTATAVFGDARLVVGDDGRDTDRLVVTTTAVFGDVRVEVPSGWQLEDRITRLLGDVTLPAQPPSAPGTPVVVLHGLVALGDVRVRYTERTEGGR
ncbi:MAG: DUF5668 domain-containing protein [Nitriliruptoraceae bacterium]